MALSATPQCSSVRVLVFTFLCCRALAQGESGEGNPCEVSFFPFMTRSLLATALMLSLLFGFARDPRTKDWAAWVLNDFMLAFISLLIFSQLGFSEGASRHWEYFLPVFALTYIVMIGFLYCLALFPRYLHCLSPIANHVTGLIAISTGRATIGSIDECTGDNDKVSCFARMLVHIAFIIMFFVYLAKATHYLGRACGSVHDKCMPRIQRRLRRALPTTATSGQDSTATSGNEALSLWHERCSELCIDAAAACLGCNLSFVAHYQVYELLLLPRALASELGVCKQPLGRHCYAFYNGFDDFVFWVVWTLSMWFLCWLMSESHNHAALNLAAVPLAQQAPAAVEPTQSPRAVERRVSARAASPAPRGSTAVQPADANTATNQARAQEAHGHDHAALGAHGKHSSLHDLRQILQLTCSFSASWGLVFAAKYVCWVWMTPMFDLQRAVQRSVLDKQFNCLEDEHFKFAAAVFLAFCCSFFMLIVIWMYSVWLVGKFGATVNEAMRAYMANSFCLFVALVWDQAFDEALEDVQETFTGIRSVIPYSAVAVILYVYVYYMEPDLRVSLHEKQD